MLYVTTRGNVSPQTAYHALREATGEDGGLYVPMQLPKFSAEDLGGMTFGQTVAEVLNRFFSTQLTGWDVDFAIGRYPIRLLPMSHRIFVTEIWHNPELSFHMTCRELTALISGDAAEEAGSWGKIAITIAFLFGIYGELIRSGSAAPDSPVDISVACGDFSLPMAALYAKRMGLPVANVVVCCNENCAPWDLVCKGELKTVTPALKTALPACDHALPPELERLLHLCGGTDAVGQYRLRAEQGGVYFPDDDTALALRTALCVSVISSQRVPSSQSHLHASTGREFGLYDTLAWNGLMDHRARAGEVRPGLVIAEESP